MEQTLEFEEFIADIRKSSGDDGSLEITIPFKTGKFMGLNKGDSVKVKIAKISLI